MGERSVSAWCLRAVGSAVQRKKRRQVIDLLGKEEGYKSWAEEEESALLSLRPSISRLSLHEPKLNVQGIE